jgi:diguanylate cyclase (GGDEF)-like protein
MSSDANKPAVAVPNKSEALNRALDRSELVHEKVEQAAVDLSVVNEALKDELGEGVPLTRVEHALNQSEAIEVKVQEAATELVTVNDALAAEINGRHQLEQQLSQSDAALSRSRTALRKANHSALHDAITGLPNLTLFNDRLRVALAQAQRHGWRLAVMFIDLDGFKVVNDNHGHDVGDRVLQIVAQRLEKIVRRGDTVSRRSGDEFLFLMLEAKDEANVVALAHRIMAELNQPCDIDGVSVEVTASVGLALYPEDGQTTADLLEHADAAMYAAKKDSAGPALYSQIPHAETATGGVKPDNP